MRLHWIVCAALVLLVACGPAGSDDPEKASMILATTTSTQDSGLLDVLVPLFQEQSGYLVQTVAVGTGAALRMAEEGNADVLLVHAPTAEQALMTAGFGKERVLVMHNDFVLVGPRDDPAGVRGLTDSAETFSRIAASQSTFASRGDDSGTHKKELAIWQAAGEQPAEERPEWYVESGQGMGRTLFIASEKSAYVLTDRATYLAQRDNLELEILVEGDPVLLNIYHTITVNPEKWPETNQAGAQAFADFMVSAETQSLIESFGIEKFGQPLFFPDAGKTEADFGYQ